MNADNQPTEDPHRDDHSRREGGSSKGDVLSPRLLAPSSILAITLLALTTLPMASCNDGKEVIVPAQMAIQLTGYYESPRPSVSQQIGNFFRQTPILFIWTWPYWTCLPVLTATLALPVSHRWATRLWRSFWLSLAIALIANYIGAGMSAYAVIAFAAAAIAIVIWSISTPWLTRAMRYLRRKQQPTQAASPISTLTGGFLMTVALSGASLMALGVNPELLIGGKLAAVTNLLLVLVSLASIRQARRDAATWPRIYLRELIISVAVIAICLSWLFVEE